MSLLALIVKEALHTRLHSALTLVAVLVAVALPVAFVTAGAAAERETSRLMRDLGYNLRIIPAETDMGAFWQRGFSDRTLPGEAVERFRDRPDLEYRHLIAMLQGHVDWRGQRVVLTGIANEVSPVGQSKGSMIFAVDPGTLVVGWEPARTLGLEPGQSVELRGRPFTVAQCLAESGTAEDVRVWGHLADVQALLELPGRINEIKALECYCQDPGVDSLAALRSELAEILPEGRVLRLEAIAEAREGQRRMAAGYFALVMPWVVVACAAWIAFLAITNVRERRHEIGVLRALGHGSGLIAALFLGKAAVIGIVGAALGWGLGSVLAVQLGPTVFEATAAKIAADPGLLGWSLFAAPLFATAASFVPAVFAIVQDPAVTLRAQE